MAVFDCKTQATEGKARVIQTRAAEEKRVRFSPDVRYQQPEEPQDQEVSVGDVDAELKAFSEELEVSCKMSTR